MEGITINYNELKAEMANMNAQKIGENGSIELWFSPLYRFIEVHSILDEDNKPKAKLLYFSELIKWDLQ